MPDAPRASVLFRWPTAAKFGHAVPKTKFYEHANVRVAMREKFIRHVQRITWAYKLAEDTIRLRGTPAVPEVQVFTVEAKGADVPDDVLTVIDRSVHFPIIFEIASDNRVRPVAAQKALHGNTPTVGAYLTTSWLFADSVRRPLPTALDLPSLHEAILSSLLPVNTRAGETVSQATDRLDRARKLQGQIAGLERKLRAEPQLNRKIELRRQIKERAAALTELTDPIPSKE